MHSEHGASMEDGSVANHVKPRETALAGEKELTVLRDWLNQNASGAKSLLVLRALVEESLKKTHLPDEHRRFTDEELCDAADVEPFDWRDVRTWWCKRSAEIANAMQQAALSVRPELFRDSGGGRGNPACNAILIGPLDNPDADESAGDEAVLDGEVRYRPDPRQPIRLNGMLRKWVFAGGEAKVGSVRHNLLRGRIVSSGMAAALFALLILLEMAWRSRPLETREIGVLILLAIFAKFWWNEWRPVYFARMDRICPLPDEWLKDDDLPAQLERRRTDASEILRLVRYTAACPVCGSDLHLAEGAPDHPRRTVGRCLDAPREHVFSFDPVSHRGMRIE